MKEYKQYYKDNVDDSDFEENENKERLYKLRQHTRNVKQKGTNALFRLLFSRTMITLLLLAGQIVLLFEIFFKLISISTTILTIFNILGAITIVFIINSEENPAFKLVWMLPICLFPVFGVAFYLFLLINPGNRGLQKLLDKRKDETAQFLRTDYHVLEKLKKEDTGIYNLGHYIQTQNGFPTYDHTKVKFFPLGEYKYLDLLDELKKAEKFIFLEYFIINKGEVWNSILEILIEKAKQGVEVRVMYDGMCSLIALPFHYPRELKKLGIKAKMFSPIRPLLSTHQNNRDHRKILVIDGRVAYNGGINLSDEYMNLKRRFGHWKDTAVKLEGEAVRSFTIMFLQLWNMTENGEEDYAKYLVKNNDFKEGAGFVIPYNDDPINRLDIAEDIYLDIINKAQKYVHIMTPYLIIDHEMITALTFAARRGVDVKIIMPHIPDKKVVFAIARTYYPELLEAGVHIYEYTPGFIHAKEFISDDSKAVVGSINLDYRSLFEHFECATLIYKNPVVGDIEKDYQNTLLKCMKIDYQFCVDLPIMYRLFGHLCKLFAPLV